MAQSRVTASRSGRARRWVAAVAGVGGGLAIGSSFLPWISTATVDGGTTSITGWGGITGSSGIAGSNLNDVLDGAGSYRPGVLGLIFGSIALIAAIAVASVSNGRRPHRITAAMLSLTGLICTGWGVFRGIDPGDAGVFEAGDVSAALGPWLTALGGVLMLVAAAAIFAGVIDPPPPQTRRGIQPR
jgi:hypothetical protein